MLPVEEEEKEKGGSSRKKKKEATPPVLGGGVVEPLTIEAFDRLENVVTVLGKSKEDLTSFLARSVGRWVVE